MASRADYVPPAFPLAKGDPFPRPGILIVHQAFRDDIKRMQKALAAMAPDQAWQALNFAQYFDFFNHALHSHHNNEERFFFPALKKHAPAAAAVVDAVEEEHEALLKLLERMCHDVNALRANAGNAAVNTPVLDRLRVDMAAMYDGMHPHLTREETEILSLWLTQVPPAVQKATEQQIVQAEMPLGHLALPWFLSQVTENEYELFMGHALPPPVQCLLHRLWRPRFHSRMFPLLTSIYDPSVVSPHLKPAGNWFWCCAGYDADDPKNSGLPIGEVWHRSAEQEGRFAQFRDTVALSAAAVAAAAAPPPAVAPSQVVMGASPATSLPAAAGAGAAPEAASGAGAIPVAAPMPPPVETGAAAAVTTGAAK